MLGFAGLSNYDAISSGVATSCLVVLSIRAMEDSDRFPDRPADDQAAVVVAIASSRCWLNAQHFAERANRTERPNRKRTASTPHASVAM